MKDQNPNFDLDYFDFYERLTEALGIALSWDVTQEVKTVGDLEQRLFYCVQQCVSNRERNLLHFSDGFLTQLNHMLRRVLFEPLYSTDAQTPLEELLRSKSHSWHTAYKRVRKMDARLPELSMDRRSRWILSASMLLGVLPVWMLSIVFQFHIIWTAISLVWTIVIAIVISNVSQSYYHIPNPYRDYTLGDLLDSWIIENEELQRSLSIMDVQRIVRSEYRIFLSRSLGKPVDEVHVDAETVLPIP